MCENCLIEHEKTGLLVPPKDPKALATAIIRVLTNKREAREMGMRARNFIEKEFSDRTMIDRTLEVYAHIKN